MRLVRYYEHGGPEVLRVEESPPPDPGPGQIRVSCEVIGASFVDTTIRAGTSPFGAGKLPGAPHGEVVGVVNEVGDGVDERLIGQRVSVLALEAYADQIVAGAEWAASVPDGVSSDDATVLAMAAPCALLALSVGQLAPGDTVLIHAAAGSIGHLTVQLARILGAGQVLATVGSPTKRDFVTAIGADEVITLEDGWTDAVRAAAPAGVDVAIDVIGGAVSAATMALLAEFGRHVIFGAASGLLPELPAAPLLGMRSLTGFGINQWRAARPREAHRQLATVTRYLADGRLRPAIQAKVSLDQPWQAHSLLEDRDRVGRVLLTP